MEELLNNCLYDAMVDRAREQTVELVCLGLGYTAVQTSDGSVGVAYTYFDRKTGCNLVGNYQDFEGRPAVELLALIKSDDPLERSMALALVNALNHADVRHLPLDKDNSILFDALGIAPSTKVAMVGYIKPLVNVFEKKGVEVAVIDEFRSMGTPKEFYHKLAHWADAALITATTILNNSVEDILSHLGKGVKAALLGPSTPMVASAFSNWPAVKALAGIVPIDAPDVLKSVRHGLGRKFLHKHSHKVTLPCNLQAKEA